MLLIVVIYLSVKPSDSKTRMLVVSLLMVQTLNFEVLSVEVCGTLAMMSSCILNGACVKFIPKIIHDKQKNLINLPISVLSSVACFIWLLQATLTKDYYFGLS